ncbi:MAG TPA: hypothetical protein H9885_01865 [Candidatus Jeotgalicoccus stercoravium]|nr:hypothetical protein [Candidatus Jeotgalicoccus stercoravium]
MIQKEWENKNLGTVIVKHTDAEKFKVSDMLTVGKEYTLVNETEEYYFVIDNSGKVAGYYKTYFSQH